MRWCSCAPTTRRYQTIDPWPRVMAFGLTLWLDDPEFGGDVVQTANGTLAYFAAFDASKAPPEVHEYAEREAEGSGFCRRCIVAAREPSTQARSAWLVIPSHGLALLADFYREPHYAEDVWTRFMAISARAAMTVREELARFDDSAP